MIKKLILLVIIFMGLYFIYDHNYYGSRQFVRDIKREISIPQNNSYLKNDINVNYIKQTTDFYPNNKQEIMNIYYTALNSGWHDFVFYCNYDECIDDVNEMSGDAELLSNLNSFVNPFNSYETISTYTTPNLNDKVEIIITPTYDDNMIKKINSKVDEIYNSLSLANDDVRTQIRKIHDYIINNTKYDPYKAKDVEDETYQSESAYGLLYEHYAICSGYADTMAIFLNKLNIPNMKVTGDDHVWNLVKIDNKWYHLDLTWDDPYFENGNEMLNYNFFLINYEQLKNWNTEEHKFDETVYQEAL